MGAARLSFMAMPEVGFWKLCGSGMDEGFTPIPNTAVWASLATWPSEDIARDRVAHAPVYRRWRDRSDEDYTLFLSPASARGKWSGTEPFSVEDTTLDGPVAALTRASVKPSVIRSFWGRTPAIQDVIRDDPNVMFKIGIGEVPWLHQVTFSIWPDTRTMAEFARRKDGPHAKAIQAVRDGAWFKEELYARFRVLGAVGQWEGADPLRTPERSAA
jgi:spheroidene monooxygenase